MFTSDTVPAYLLPDLKTKTMKDDKMRTYLISYDLAEPATIKNILTSEIMEMGQSWARPLANTWYVRSDEDRDVLEDRLRDHLDIDDGLLIQQVRDDAVMMNTDLRWFRQRLNDNKAPTVSNVVAFPGAATPDQSHEDASELVEATPFAAAS